MPEGFIVVWERISFKGADAVKWERSMDKGKTWEEIHWPFGQLPFVLFDRDSGITEVVRIKFEDDHASQG